MTIEDRKRQLKEKLLNGIKEKKVDIETSKYGIGKISDISYSSDKQYIPLSKVINILSSSISNNKLYIQIESKGIKKVVVSMFDTNKNQSISGEIDLIYEGAKSLLVIPFDSDFGELESFYIKDVFSPFESETIF